MAQTSNHYQSSLKPRSSIGSRFHQEYGCEATKDIRDQMAETRASLAEKIEKLENKVLGTVETAQASVEQTAEAVKDTVEITTANIQRTFDLKHQVDRNPWLMVGGSVFAGYVLGVMSTSRPSAPSNGKSCSSTSVERIGAFDEEVEMMKGLAVGVAAGVLRDSLKEAMPGLASEVDHFMNTATRKLGGRPIEGPILRPADSECIGNGLHRP
jgi:hypothetical protein